MGKYRPDVSSGICTSEYLPFHLINSLSFFIKNLLIIHRSIIHTFHYRKIVTSKLQSWVFILKNFKSSDVTEFRIFTRDSCDLIKRSNSRASKRESNQEWQKKVIGSVATLVILIYNTFPKFARYVNYICVNKHIIIIAPSSVHKIK